MHSGILGDDGHRRFARMNQLTLIDVHGLDVAVDSRAPRHNMAVDLCIDSAFVLESIPGEIADCDEKFDQRRDCQDSFAAGF